MNRNSHSERGKTLLARPFVAPPAPERHYLTAAGVPFSKNIMKG